MKSFLVNTSLGAAEGFAGFDALFRRSVTKVIPRFQQLVDHPADYLAAEDVRIGPCIRWVTGIFFGVILGALLSCGIAFDALTSRKPKSANEQAIYWMVVVSGPFLTSIVLLYWLRGGTIVLRKDSVEFRYRRNTVVCSWEFFDSPAEPEWIDKFTLAMAVNSYAIDEAKLRIDGAEQTVGPHITTLQFRFRPPETQRVTNNLGLREIALRDIYKARLNEIGSLILTLSRELGRKATANRS